MKLKYGEISEKCERGCQNTCKKCKIPVKSVFVFSRIRTVELAFHSARVSVSFLLVPLTNFRSMGRVILKTVRYFLVIRYIHLQNRLKLCENQN